jgi:hypothetical protein
MYKRPPRMGMAYVCAGDKLDHRREAPIRVTLLVAAVLLATVLLSPTRAFGLTISEPTVIGPSEGVHNVSQGGFDGGYVWVSAQGFGSAEVHAALWETNSLTPGVYAVEAWMPNESGAADARYKITHKGVTSEVLVSQYEVISGEWVRLGVYEFDEHASVRSTDAAGDPGDRIDWSDMRWTRIASLPPRIEVSGLTTTVREPVITGSEEFFARFAGVGYGGWLSVGEAQGSEGATIDTATWSAPLSAGEYGIEVFIPEAHREAEVDYLVHTAGGAVPVEIKQPKYKNTWVKLGQFQLGGTAEVTSSDATGSAGQDIAWSALRFVQLSRAQIETLIPSSQQVQSPTTTEQPRIESPIKPTKPGTALLPARPASVALPLVHVPKELLKFATLQIERAAHEPHPGPADLYKVIELLNAKRLAVRFRCDPCLIVDRPLRLHDHDVPYIHTSYAEGPMQTLIARASVLYKGTVLLVEVRKRSHQHTWLSYNLTGAGEVRRSHSCAARPGPIGVCLR